ncbi:MAG TPA: BamA/TamA family outer membrane protein [Chitinophagales bacterium]|nr:BamA/TamA family outer membrane protein [Chitinophagales bacterium]HRP38889.1 BamA/TamA family outer membrane protein [Chitinophagales bacterium]
MSKIGNSFISWWILLLSVALFSVSSCSVVKNIPEGRRLLLHNKVAINKADVNKVIKTAERDRLKEDLSAIIQPKPNKRFLGIIPFRLWFYIAANKGKDNKFNRWIKSKVGEPPVLFDSLIASKTEVLMENYLWNYGYFENDVSYTTKNNKRQRISVTYKIDPGRVWTLGKISFPTGTTTSEGIVRLRVKNTVLKTGDRFDVTNLKAERSRIEADLRNNGFFSFNKEYVTFDLDTNREAHTVNINVKVNQPMDNSEHKPYRMNRVIVFTDYEPGSQFVPAKYDTISLQEFRFVQQKTLFKNKVLRDAIFFREGELFTQDNYDKSMTRLNELGVFKFASIELHRSKRDTNLLNAFVYLTPSKKQTLSAGGNLNHNFDGLTGIGGNVSYKNRNLTKGADQLSIDASVNLQLNFSKNRSKMLSNDRLNTIDFTLDATYYLNRFLVPFKTKIYSNTNPKTKINARYNYEIRRDFPSNYPLYNAHNIGVTYGYEWSARKLVRHYYNPTFLNFYFIHKEDSFINYLKLRPSLSRSYNEQIIWGSNYSFVLSNKAGKYDLWSTLLKGSIEAAGNILELGFMAANKGYSPNQTFNILNRPFSQYMRFEFDFRNYFRLNRHSQFAMRHYIGLGLPYGNSKQLPYTKQFFVGGLNSLRGFQIREIGPGSYRDSTIDLDNPSSNQATLFIDQTGDIKFEMNIELRFDIYKWLKGAAFMDAGNVWLMRNDPTRALGNFDFKRFINEFGVDFGAGLRLDFNYFVIRLDYGVPIRDPRIQKDNKWTIRKGQFNLAIGYPF